MGAPKRSWIYTGLAVPSGIALVRQSGCPPARPGGRLLLAGAAGAELLATPLLRLAADRGIASRVVVRPASTPTDWLREGWLLSHLVDYAPSHVVLALAADSPDSAKLAALVRSARAVLCWVPPVGRDKPRRRGACEFVIHDGRLDAGSAAGYAALSGAVMRAIG